MPCRYYDCDVQTSYDALGVYGAREGLSSPECTALCPVGYYCPEGSKNGTTYRCPAGRYGGFVCTDFSRVTLCRVLAGFVQWRMHRCMFTGILLPRGKHFAHSTRMRRREYLPSELCLLSSWLNTTPHGTCRVLLFAGTVHNSRDD